ncbi:hypothetical protein [Desulfoscipio sp. XC116]|uniref:hypothetical protein n=1 Tax=Desulfoscipio sp. XC116 TaxID=3144975 RepID=UPI00325B5F79
MKKCILFRVTVFLLGMITGAALTGIFIGKQIDDLSIKNRSLADGLAVAEKELEQLRQANETIHARVVTKISAHISFAEECDYSEYEQSTIELTVEKKVREWLKIISGQELETINYLLVPRIVDNRELEVEGKKIRLKVLLVVLSEHVIVYLEIIPIQNMV